MKPSLSRKCIVPRPIKELIEELKFKLTLLEGERTAHFETSLKTMQRNKEKIAELRKEVHSLRTTYWESTHKDEAVISQAFQNRPVEKSTFLNKSSEQAISEFDFRVSAAMKRYNYSKYVTDMKEKKLRQLRQEMEDAEGDLAEDVAEAKRRTPQLQQIRDLENRVDKLELKGNESEFIQKAYEAIFWRMYKEHVRCNRTLDVMEADIVRCRAENRDLKETHKEAQARKAETEKELRKHERFELGDSKRRDFETARMRRVIEEEMNKSAERGERRHPHGGEGDEKDSSLSLTLNSGEPTVPNEPCEGMTVPIEVLEDKIEKLRGVTGINDLKDMVIKFEKQLLVKENLICLINKMEQNIQDLRQDCVKKEEELTRVKNTIERNHDEMSQKVAKKNSKADRFVRINQEINERSCELSVILAHSKAGLEHIVEKMTLVKLPEKGITPKPASPEEYMAELFDFIHQKIRILLEELKNEDVDGFRQKMVTEENLVLLQGGELEQEMRHKLPAFNDRMKAPEPCKDDEYDSGHDNPSFKSRQVIKHESSQHIEMRFKKRQRKRKHRKN